MARSNQLLACFLFLSRNKQRAGPEHCVQTLPAVLGYFLFVDFHLVEYLDELGVAVVHNLAVTDVQLGDFGHILVTELEVPDVDMLRYALLVDRLGMTVTPLKYGADCAEHYNQNAY